MAYQHFVKNSLKIIHFLTSMVVLNHTQRTGFSKSCLWYVQVSKY